MNINDLLVSYNQVQVPSYMQDSAVDYEPIGEELINQENLERVQNRSQKKEGFAGWKPLEQSEVSQQSDDRTPTGNEIVNFFMNKGLTKNQARGIYGNIMQESGGKHNIISRDGHNSYGLAQWTGSRKARLFSKYGTNPTVNQQLEYLWEELNSSEKGALDALKSTSSVEDATKIFMQKFERPANWAANFKNRLKYANSVV